MMIDFQIRQWRQEDRPALAALFQSGFGDDAGFIDSFFSLYLKPGCCLVAEADGRVVSSMYILPEQMMFPSPRNKLSAGYAYALSTLPEYRGNGIGTEVYRAVCDEILKKADCACVLPSDQKLYPFYEDANGAKPVSYVREAVISKDELAGIPSAQAARVQSYQYPGFRELLLSGTPHVTYGEDLYELMESSGFDFFVMDNGFAAAETIDGVCYIRELLDPHADSLHSLAALARWCPAEKYVVRTPLFFDGPGQPRPFMLGVFKQENAVPASDELWWPFALE